MDRPAPPLRPRDPFEPRVRRLRRSVSSAPETLDLRGHVPRWWDSLRRLGRSRPSLGRILLVVAVLAVVVGVGLAFVLMPDDSGGPGRVSVAATGPSADAVRIAAVVGTEGALTFEPGSSQSGSSSGAATPANPLQALLDPIDALGDGSAAGGDNASNGGGGGSSVAASPGTLLLSVPELVRLHDLTNAERQRNGVAPLEVDAGLNATAQAHADWMARNGVLCHSSRCHPSAEPRGWNGWGENVGYTASGSPDELQRAFVASPSHEANMIDPRHTAVGYGWAVGRLHESGTPVSFAVVQFGMQPG